MKLSIRPSCDLKRLSLSKADARIMETCVALSSDVWTGMIDGEVVCVWGVAPPSLMSQRAYLWLYTTDKVKEHQFSFVRHSQIVLEDLLNVYDLITGHCVIGQDNSIRWLKWLGAQFGEPDGKLIPFQIRRKHG